MFDSLSDNLSAIFKKLRGKGFLSEDDVNTAMREVRVALLGADVALPVVKTFIEKVKERAIGEEVVKSISPAQMVIKIVQDNLVEVLGSDAVGLDLKVNPPAVIMMVGLQGSGKTTSTGKLANMLKAKHNKKTLMASLDVYRPAAQHQLEVLGRQVGVEVLSVIEGEQPVAITKRALQEAKLGGYDVLFLDTAGRLHIDEALMQELQEVKKLSNPVETMLVADALTGQDAVNIAQQFNEKVGVTGIMLTRMDGDGRGGAALSMRSITGCPIKFIGVGEKISEIEPFHPERVATRILGMGDIVSMVEKAREVVDQEEAEKMEKKFRKGEFDLSDMAKQFRTMKKMGGFGGIMGMMPGIGKMKAQLEESGVGDSMLEQMEAIISSMTAQEKRFPKVINGSRRLRIAKGSGVEVSDVNKLLKLHKQMHTMMKKLSGMSKQSMLRGGLQNLMPKHPRF